MKHNQQSSRCFVESFRNSAPYINAFRGKVFVICFDGELLHDARFSTLVQDIALLTSLGIRLVLVHGVRPQIEQRLKQRGLETRYVNGVRITDDAALKCVQEATGAVRMEIEALLSMGLPNTPMAGAAIRVVSGNFVTARPLGIVDGIDFQHTGSIRRIDHDALQQILCRGAIALLSPVGYSPTGEFFNLTAQEVAAATAVALHADKLIYLIGAKGLRDSQKRLLRELTVEETQKIIGGKRQLAAEIAEPLRHAFAACSQGVRRSHLIDRHIDGGLLLELFTRDGCGTMISADCYEGLRRATIDDVGGIIRLIAPLEEKGILVQRSRENLEMEIDKFIIVERDGMTIACAALFPFHGEQAGEIACLAVHPDYRNHGYGERLLSFLEKQAVSMGLERLFVLTTHAIHWFQEHGFHKTELGSLPMQRRKLYNYQRNSRVLVKELLNA